MAFSVKQKEYIANANRRWNIKTGATRSGKSYLDLFIIPARIRARIGKPGLTVILGVTKGTIERNVLEPMREIWGSTLVGEIGSDNKAYLFGEYVYCLGAEKVSQVSKLRGASIKYAYGDEVADWSEEVFELLKSRLDKEYSCFDGALNPQGPDHWLKVFLESDADIYCQQYTIFDNPFLPPKFVEELCKEYEGTVFYDRYILGKWALAEGLLFKFFADNPKPYLISPEKTQEFQYTQICIGIDFGGNKSKTTFYATGFVQGYKKLVALAEDSLPAQAEVNATQITLKFLEFANFIKQNYGAAAYAFGDNASSTMVYELERARRDADISTAVTGCNKDTILNRVRTIGVLLQSGRLCISSACPNLISALSTLRWADDRQDEVEDKNIGNCNDYFDGFCYSWSKFIKLINLNR